MTGTGSQHPAPPAATLTGDRTLAPDLGRGLMLLPIALAHVHLVLYVADYQPSLLDQSAVFFREVLVDNRARPMFFFLFGYGLVQLTTRLEARGDDWGNIRPLLRRRGWWLVLIGLAHAAIIGVDIVSVYGFALVCLTGLLIRSDRALLRTTAVTTAAMVVFFFATSAVEIETDVFMTVDVTAGSTDPAVMVVRRVAGWALVVIAYGWHVIPAMLLGVWAARRRILEQPRLHLKALRRAAVAGIGLAIAGAVPWALISTRAIPAPDTWSAGAAGALHGITGMAGGLGAIAAIALVANNIGESRGPVATAVAALGQRSLTLYMFQSVVFLVAFAPFTTGLGAHSGFFIASLIAIATWLLSLVLAEAMRRRGHRGPAELLLRRLTYGGRT